MELIRSLTVESIASGLDLFRFGLISTLQLIKTVFLLYPLNVLLLSLIVLSGFYKVVKKILPKSKFSATYVPLPHHQNSIEEIKVLKKQMREVQSQLVELLKNVRNNDQISSNQPQPHQSYPNQVEVDTQIQTFLAESQQKSQILQQVEQELRKTVVAAYSQVTKLRSN